MLFEINQIIAGVTTLLLIIFSTFLITIKREKNLNQQLLLVFLLVNTTYLIAYLIISNIRPITLFIFTGFYLLHTSGFLFGPVLFFYTKTIIYNYKIGKRDFIHLFPFFFISFYVLIRLLVLTNFIEAWEYPVERFIYNLLLNLQVMIYMILSIMEVKNYRIKIRNFYSSIERINYYWLSIVLYGFFFMWIVDFSHFLIGRFSELPLIINQSFGTLSLTINFIFAVLIFYEGLKRPEYFHLIEIREEKPKEKYEKSRLSKTDADNYLAKLKSFMLAEKPYLNPEITINELSEKVDIPTRYLSQVINDSLNKNFYDFINSYRIEEAKESLVNSNSVKKTILEILYEAGFNSKSTFNKVFKDYTGLTPTEYRRQNYSSQRYLKFSK